MTIRAKPGLNGNSPEDFQSRARKLNEAADVALIQLRAARGEILHGRNYQYLDANTARYDRGIDLGRFEEIENELLDMQKLALEIFDAGR